MDFTLISKGKAETAQMIVNIAKQFDLSIFLEGKINHDDMFT